jgi:2-dehydro-3-deoxyphosphogluconate aldolase/(4S)-4-hydroxy-2-oxoglutarate aldolase
MSNQVWLSQLKKHRAIAVIRASKMVLGEQMALAVASGGMQLIEITWNSDRAPELISQLRAQLPDCMIGTGTLFNVQQLQEAIACGSQFLFTPHTDPEMIQTAVSANIPIIPGALTPTEIMTAWNYGASCVKVFPVQAVGGTSYIPLIPTGGVTLENAKDFLQVGAIAVGLSGELFPSESVLRGNWTSIREQAKTLMQRLH